MLFVFHNLKFSFTYRKHYCIYLHFNIRLSKIRHSTQRLLVFKCRKATHVWLGCRKPDIRIHLNKFTLYYFDNRCVFHWLILISKRGSFDLNLKRGTFHQIKYSRNCDVTLFIFWALATLSVLRCHLTFALECLTFFTITTFRTFRYLCCLQWLENCVWVKKSGIDSWQFSGDDLLRLSTWISRQECIDQLISTFGDAAPSYGTV